MVASPRPQEKAHGLVGAVQHPGADQVDGESPRRLRRRPRGVDLRVDVAAVEMDNGMRIVAGAGGGKGNQGGEEGGQRDGGVEGAVERVGVDVEDGLPGGGAGGGEHGFREARAADDHVEGGGLDGGVVVCRSFRHLLRSICLGIDPIRREGCYPVQTLPEALLAW